MRAEILGCDLPGRTACCFFYLLLLLGVFLPAELVNGPWAPQINEVHIRYVWELQECDRGEKRCPELVIKWGGDHLTERQQFSPLQYYFFPLCYHSNMSCAICRSLLEQVLASAGSGQGLVWKNVSPEIERKRNGESTVCYPDVRKSLNNTHTFTLPGTHTFGLAIYDSLCAWTEIWGCIIENAQRLHRKNGQISMEIHTMKHI